MSICRVDKSIAITAGYVESFFINPIKERLLHFKNCSQNLKEDFS